MSTIKDYNGLDIPTKLVPKMEMAKHRLSVKHYKKLEALQHKMAKAKAELLQDVDVLYKELLEKHNIKNSGKGNFTMTSYDRNIKIESKMQDSIGFSEDIELAQLKLNDFLEAKTKGADPELSILVNNAFKTSKGRLDTKRVLGLFSYKITHKLWKEAMDLIQQSITRDSSKRYINVYKKNEEGEYKILLMNFSSI